MNIIAAVSSDWGIGLDNQLLFRIPEDQKFFKSMTTDKVVVMGYNTLLSLPGSKPLPNRVNIVLSRKPTRMPGVVVCESMDALNTRLRDFAPDDVFIIGGQKVYAQLLDQCQFAYITKIQAAPEADAFFPDLDMLPHWKLIESSDEKIHNGLCYRFHKYENFHKLYSFSSKKP